LRDATTCFRTWLLTIARTRSLDRLRARRRRREESADAVDEDGGSSISTLTADPRADSSAGAEHEEQSRLVRAALAELPAEQRATLELAYFAGLSQSEIAEKMNEPLGTVKTRTRMALQKLRGALAGLRDNVS